MPEPREPGIGGTFDLQQVFLFQFVHRLSLALLSMMEAEIIAVLEGFKAVARLEIRNGGRKVANKLAIYIDNLEGQRLIAAILKEPAVPPC